MRISAVLIVGTANSPARSAEIFNPITKTSCSLPQLPEERFRHSQDGDLICGGPITPKTCVKWSPSSGSWTQSHTLRQSRFEHLSWTTASGVYLMGGMNDLSKRTTEKVKFDGSVKNGFSLKYDTG